MNSIRFFIDRPITTLMIYCILALAGFVSFTRMPVDLMPGGDTGVLTIFIGVRGGMPPEDIESLIIKPVEDEMATLANLEEMNSVARKDRAVISLNFKLGTDTSRAALEVQERMSKVKGKLPKDIEKPVVSRYDENQAPILILALASESFTPEQMRGVAEHQIKPVVKRVDGVANIEIGGGRERKILIEFDQTRLESFALPIRQVIGQIGQENINLLTGKMERGKESYFVRTVGAFSTLEDLGDLPVAVTREGSRIRLRDIAEIRDFYMEADSYSRMNRAPVVSVYIQKEALANTITTAKKIKELVEDMKKTLDQRIKLSIVSDQSIAIEEALNKVRHELITGAILAGLILILFLRDFLLSSFIFVSIPLTLIITFAVMIVFDLSLNVMTISGLAIATGMIVDDSIVVLENIIHYKQNYLRALSRQSVRPVSGVPILQLEKPHYQIPILATNEMLLALVSSTLTTVIVFVPIIFLNPQVRMVYSGLAITVSASLILSLFVAITVVPVLSARVSTRWMQQSSYFSTYFWLYLQNKVNHANVFLSTYWFKLKKYFLKKTKKDLDSDIIYAGNAAPRLLKFRKGFSRYRRIVAWLMHHRYLTAGILLGCLLTSLVLYRFLDKEFAGTTEENEFTIFVELPSGTKLEVSDRVVTAVERVLNETSEIQQSVKTSVSRVEGWSSKIYVTLVPTVERTKTAQEVITFLRPLISKVGQEYDAFIYFSEPSSAKEFIIDIYGYDYTVLRDLAIRMSQFLQSIPGLMDVKLRYKPGRPEVRIEVDRERAALLSFSIQDIAESFHAQIRGLRATYFLTQTEQVETVARLQEQYRKTLGDVENLSLINPHGVIVPMHQFASIAYGLTPSEVWRKNRERMIQVSANRGDLSLSKVAEIVLQVLPQVKAPPGYYYQIGGDYTKMVETEKESSFAFIIMILLIYVVLASLFESYTQPLVILIAIPFTLIGAFPLLWFTKTPVTIGVLIGMIMLGGIAVKNSIMLIDVFNRIREEKSYLRALLQAGQERMRPIIMTTLTTVLGMAPMIFEKGGSGSLWKPMALTITGGLIVSTILVLFVVPAFYLILQDVISWIQKKFVSGFKNI